MELYRGKWGDLPTAEGEWAVALGTFDGVHRGHQAILAELRSHADAHGLRGTTAVSFSRHPRALLDPAGVPPQLCTLDEKIHLLAAAGVDRLVLLEFDASLAALEYDVFVREILLSRLGLKHFVLGHDVHFGAGRRGTVVTVAELADREGFGLSQVASIREGDEPISSTRLRRVIAEGRVEEAALLLGHPYPLFGQVVHGRGEGEGLGAATANIDFEGQAKLLPADGVYAGWARWGTGAWMPSVMNIGVAPTMTDAGVRRLEVHVLEESMDLYGEQLQVACSYRLREERKFDSREALMEQIQHDLIEAKALIGGSAAWCRPESLDSLQR